MNKVKYVDRTRSFKIPLTAEELAEWRKWSEEIGYNTLTTYVRDLVDANQNLPLWKLYNYVESIKELDLDADTIRNLIDNLMTDILECNPRLYRRPKNSYNKIPANLVKFDEND